MKANLGAIERVLRLVLGVVVLGLYGALPEPWRYLTLVGLVPFGTALTGFCPLKAVLTRRRA
jgi:hypothetical protein